MAIYRKSTVVYGSLGQATESVRESTGSKGMSSQVWEVWGVYGILGKYMSSLCK